ncbi:hypothetical protein D0869_00694 [Hortaea werneckii]|uniref:Mercuric reductase n=1 Tax=Hortaea werneckii TaxID=91943 RepID=A0A3M6XFU3_HORWE|nr:hypothetical protein KC324_g1788 [Hortaea werneckii]KAI7595685.1 hypothetical protein KC316_g375 [Hortaea werneckii]RMX89685.1 hypothetical protein D0869_00694 [Hortaea werneckii]
MGSSPKKFDYIVIGSGQAGTPLATALAQSGRRTALIERSHIGGCCVNEGCTPTKTMIASGRVAHLASRAGDFGVWQTSSMPVYAALRSPVNEDSPPVAGAEAIAPKVDMLRVRDRKKEIVDSFRSGSEARLANVEGLEVIFGEAHFSSPNVIEVIVAGSENVELEAGTFFINTGERPAMPDLPGLDAVLLSKQKTKVLNSTSIQELEEVPEKLIVLGGGYIGLEFGQLFQRLGSKVTIVQRGNQLLPREDTEVSAAVKEIVESEGVEVLLSAKAFGIRASNQAIFPITLDCKVQGTQIALEGSHILLATGRTPNTDNLSLDKARVVTDTKSHIQVNSVLQTSAPHIYALGDCHGGPAFTHISYDDFRIIRDHFINNITSARTIENRLVPYTVYTGPQLGHIGLHESQAREKFPSRKIQTAVMPMKYVARALETNETKGLMKAVVDGESGEILGFTCLGVEGGEIMSLVQVAMMGKLTYRELQGAIFAHPTLAESLNNLWGFLK